MCAPRPNGPMWAFQPFSLSANPQSWRMAELSFDAGRPDFAETLAKRIEGDGGSKATPVYFLCRSGVRSIASAQALTAAGFRSLLQRAGRIRRTARRRRPSRSSRRVEGRGPAMDAAMTRNTITTSATRLDATGPFAQAGRPSEQIVRSQGAETGKPRHDPIHSNFSTIKSMEIETGMDGAARGHSEIMERVSARLKAQLGDGHLFELVPTHEARLRRQGRLPAVGADRLPAQLDPFRTITS